MSAKKVAVVAREGYQELEFWCTLLRAREAGAETVVIAESSGEYVVSALGYPVVPDIRLADALEADIPDVLVVPRSLTTSASAALTDFVDKVKRAGATVFELEGSPESSSTLAGLPGTLRELANAAV